MKKIIQFPSLIKKTFLLKKHNKFLTYFKVIGVDCNAQCLVFGDPELKIQNYLLEGIWIGLVIQESPHIN